jgi:hypothetical protein
MTGVQAGIRDALAKYGDLTNDREDARFGAAVYQSTADVVDAVTPMGEACALAFPAVIVRPDIRTAAFVAIFETKAVVAWRKGVFKKRTEHVVIRLADITSAEWHVSSRPSSRGATVLEINVSSENTTLGLPKDKPETAELIRDAFLASARS